MVNQEELHKLWDFKALRDDWEKVKKQAGTYSRDTSKKAKDMNKEELAKLAFRAGVCNRWEHFYWWFRVRRTWWGREEGFFDWEGMRDELIHRGY
mmetsp:Transcript_5293/g.12175  ORF Transcript_5293/g.12175 Transcript_5293/m.12175 type:complete len:95 (-) Transcript_5293:538-822(-)